MNWNRIIGFAFLMLLGAMCLPASAQDFPSKPVRLVVPFPPGGSGDIAARTAGQKLSEIWGQPVIVENRFGGNTIVAAELVWRSPPDGHTLLIPVDSTLTMNQTLYSKLPYVPSQFLPVTMLVQQPLLLSAGPKNPNIRNLDGFLKEVRANPGKINLAIGAIVTQVTAELIKTAGGIDFTIVPYQGSPPTMNAILGGQVDFSLSDIGFFSGALRDGKLRGLAVTGPRRSPALPDVPTLAEAGLKDVSVTSWFGVVAPPGTPAAVIAKLSTDFRRVLQMPDVKERLIGLGLETSPMTPDEFADRIKSESAMWERVIRAANIKLD